MRDRRRLTGAAFDGRFSVRGFLAGGFGITELFLRLADFHGGLALCFQFLVADEFAGDGVDFAADFLFQALNLVFVHAHGRSLRLVVASVAGAACCVRHRHE